jgi:hypothetical protein
VPWAYNIFRAYKGMEGRKINIKRKKKCKNVIQNKIQGFKHTFTSKIKLTVSLPVKWEVCENSTFPSLCLAKGVVDV